MKSFLLMVLRLIRTPSIHRNKRHSFAVVGGGTHFFGCQEGEETNTFVCVAKILANHQKTATACNASVPERSKGFDSSSNIFVCARLKHVEIFCCPDLGHCRLLMVWLLALVEGGWGSCWGIRHPPFSGRLATVLSTVPLLPSVRGKGEWLLLLLASW